jgi:verruculogen synthase
MAVIQDSKPQVRRFPASENPSTIWKAAEEDGAVIIEGFLPRDVIQRFDRELEPQLQSTPGARKLLFYDPLMPTTTKWLNDLPATSKAYRHEILNNPVLHNICQVAFKDSGDYWCLTGTVMETMPGNPAQPVHRDEATHPIIQHLKPDAPVPALSFIVAVTEFTKANGATRVILGSHQWPEVGTPSEAQAVQAEMNAGDVLLMNRGMVHGGAAHLEGSPNRRLLLMQMGICQLTPWETHVAIPRPLLESMTPGSEDDRLEDDAAHARFHGVDDGLTDLSREGNWFESQPTAGGGNQMLMTISWRYRKCKSGFKKLQGTIRTGVANGIEQTVPVGFTISCGRMKHASFRAISKCKDEVV